MVKLKNNFLLFLILLLVSLITQTSFGITAKEAKALEAKSCEQIHDKFYKKVINELIPEEASKGKDFLELDYFYDCQTLNTNDAKKLQKLGYKIQMNGDFVHHVTW